MTQFGGDCDPDRQASLDEIGRRFGTDKSSIHHNYLSFYDVYFRDLREKQLTILEIGVLGGASLRTWNQYFQKASIVGVDISPYAKSLAGGRVSIELADQSDIEELTQLGIKHGPFDIVIEDGSHMWEHQISSLKTLFPFVRNAGLYIVEDLQTNYGDEEITYRGNSPISCVEFLKQLLDARVGDKSVPVASVGDPFVRTYAKSIALMSFYRGTCLLKKEYIPVDRGAAAGLLLPPRTADRNCFRAEVLAHVSNVGDVVGIDGSVHSGSQNEPIQGLSVKTVDSGVTNVLQIRVRFPDGTWTDWLEENEFAGTRGQQLNLTGYAVRLTEAYADRLSLEYVGLFSGENAPVQCSSGEECVASSGKPLYAVQIDVLHRQ